MHGVGVEAYSFCVMCNHTASLLSALHGPADQDRVFLVVGRVGVETFLALRGR